MALLFELGESVGFTEESVREVQEDRVAIWESFKGLEYLGTGEYSQPFLLARESGFDISPKIIKHPIMNIPGRKSVLTPFRKVREYGWEVELAIVTLREHEAWTKARQRDRDLVKDSGGFLLHGDDDVTYQGLAEILIELDRAGTPFRLMEFPRFVKDWEYCYYGLDGVSRLGTAEFKVAFDKVADLGKVHA